MCALVKISSFVFKEYPSKQESDIARREVKASITEMPGTVPITGVTPH